jgi:outer membrane protein OmpA-like peptidoglycan-associated protein
MTSRITKTFALAALMAGSASVANATEGWYGRVDGGQSFDASAEFKGIGDGDLGDDWVQSLGMGYAFSNGFRLEGEASHRYNDFEITPGVVNNGEVQGWAAMLNGYYDFNRGGTFEPYIGLGIGMARIDVQATNAAAPQLAVNETDSVMAYQGMAGVAIGITERLDIDIGYRYFRADDVQLRGTLNAVPNTAFKIDYEHQAGMIGLRWQFATPYVAPPPPPPPPPAPPPPPPPPVAAACPTSEFVVYFEWDRSNLNAAALETIDAAVNRARQCNVGGVVVVGHTDTSGSTAYNAGLSERRASVVRDALVARGIGAGSITSQARGETDLARSTRDGVREPLNRRTAVTISFR